LSFELRDASPDSSLKTEYGVNAISKVPLEIVTNGINGKFLWPS
jgi:hypothetical protein